MKEIAADKACKADTRELCRIRGHFWCVVVMKVEFGSNTEMS
mgnify:CR=1 FL=1